MADHFLKPDLGLYVWTVAALMLVALGTVIAYRWRGLGRHAALTPALRVGVLISLLTVVWVVPGIVAAVIALLVWLCRLVLRPQGSTAE